MIKKIIIILFIFYGINKSYSQITGSGTGFLISTNGYIATCYHVIENSNEIRIRGVNGDFNKSYEANIVSTDKNNDIAILKINAVIDHVLSYGIKWGTIDVGEDIYTLGYPLKSTMGEEIKLTNGIISAKSGFKGDISNYQISIPIQPGNSGGPLFDKSGYIIGIVNAKHLNTDNVSYAIKSSFLKNLLETNTIDINCNISNLVYNKPLSEQIKIISKDVIIIEVIIDNKNSNGKELPIVILTKINAKIKKEPDALAYVIKIVEPNTKLEAVGKRGDYWEIFYDGDIAFVHDLYINESEITSYIKYSLPLKYKDIAVEVNTKYDAKLRYEPSPLSNIIQNIPKNDKIYVIGYIDGYWKIFYKGEEGYLIDGLYFDNSYQMMKFKRP